VHSGDARDNRFPTETGDQSSSRELALDAFAELWRGRNCGPWCCGRRGTPQRAIAEPTGVGASAAGKQDEWVRLGHGWGGFTFAGAVDRDRDLVARDNAVVLWLYPGSGPARTSTATPTRSASDIGAC